MSAAQDDVALSCQANSSGAFSTIHLLLLFKSKGQKLKKVNQEFKKNIKHFGLGSEFCFRRLRSIDGIYWQKLV